MPNPSPHPHLEIDHRRHILENEMLEVERALVTRRTLEAPTGVKGFLTWFEDLKVTGPGQNSPRHLWSSH